MSDMTANRPAEAIEHSPPTVPQDYLAEVDLEHAHWSEITARSFTC
jgi:hypothetical protein